MMKGVVMNPATTSTHTGQNNPSSGGRVLQNLPEDGMLLDLHNESKLHAWLLQGMTERGKAHWKDCVDYYDQHKPTVEEISPL